MASPWVTPDLLARTRQEPPLCPSIHQVLRGSCILILKGVVGVWSPVARASGGENVGAEGHSPRKAGRCVHCFLLQ